MGNILNKKEQSLAFYWSLIAVDALTILLNSLILIMFVYFRKKLLASNHNRILFSMALGDTFVGVFGNNLGVTLLLKKKAIYYKLLGNIPLFSSIFVSVLSLILLTADRLVAMKRPYLYISSFYKKIVFRLILLTWIFPAIIIIQQSVIYVEIRGKELTVRSYFFTVFFIIGVVALIGLNAVLFYGLRAYARKLLLRNIKKSMSHENNTQETSFSKSSAAPNAQQIIEKRTDKLRSESRRDVTSDGNDIDQIVLVEIHSVCKEGTEISSEKNETKRDTQHATIWKEARQQRRNAQNFDVDHQIGIDIHRTWPRVNRKKKKLARGKHPGVNIEVLEQGSPYVIKSENEAPKQNSGFSEKENLEDFGERGKGPFQIREIPPDQECAEYVRNENETPTQRNGKRQIGRQKKYSLKDSKRKRASKVCPEAVEKETANQDEEDSHSKKDESITIQQSLAIDKKSQFCENGFPPNRGASFVRQKKTQELRKTSLVCILAVTVFILSWLPLAGYRLGFAIGITLMIPWLRRLALCLTIANSLLNPVIYLLVRKEFRLYLKKLIGKIFMRR